MSSRAVSKHTRTNKRKEHFLTNPKLKQGIEYSGKAVLTKWPDGGESPLDTVYTYRIPAGTTIHTGKVGSQGGVYVGGTQQIVIQEPWGIPGIELIKKEILK